MHQPSLSMGINILSRSPYGASPEPTHTVPHTQPTQANKGITMSQNLISLNLSGGDYAEIDDLLTKLEGKLGGLIDLSSQNRRTMRKMGDKSEAFCRQTLNVLSQNPKLVPEHLDLADAQRDLTDLDALRVRTARLRQLLGRADDTEMALGSDVMSAALNGYALLKVMGKGSGLEALRADIGVRFSKAPRAKPDATTPA